MTLVNEMMTSRSQQSIINLTKINPVCVAAVWDKKGRLKFNTIVHIYPGNPNFYAG